MEFKDDSEFILRLNIIKYLEKYNIMTDLETKSCDFNLDLCNTNKIYPIFYYSITINPIQLASISGSMFQLLLNEPIYFEHVIHDIILISLQTFTMNSTIQYDQIQLYLYIDPLPTIPMTITFRRLLGLCTLKVILIGHSDIQKFMRMSIWYCSQHCVSDITTIHTIPKITMKCTQCGSHLKENENSRIISERIIAQMMINDSPLNCNSLSKIFRVDLLDDLCRKLELGCEYKLTGYMTTLGLFKAKGIIQNCKKFPLYKASISFFPTIVQLKTHSESRSPYEFVYTLASQLGVIQKLAPKQLFINLKMGILLSLASFKDNSDAAPLSLLAVGCDTYFPNQLMSLTSKYAIQCVHPSPNNNNVIGNKNKDGWYEIGSLSLANSGVCYLGDWSKYTDNKNGFLIKSALESGKIQLDETGSYRLSLKSCIWTYFAFPSTTKNHEQMQTLINLFGIPFLSDPHDDDAYVQYILEQEVGANVASQNYNIIPENEIILYLRAVNFRTVYLTPTTEELIKNYFVTCRQCRQGIFPVRVIDSLLLIAESHAKLYLRSETTKYDAIIAIWFLEECIQVMYGVDIFNPPPRYTYEIEKINEYFLLFEEWLYDFISTNHNQSNHYNLSSQFQ